MKSNSSEFHALIASLNDQLEAYLSSSIQGEGKVSRQISASELAKKMKLSHWIEHGGMTAHNAHTFMEPYLEHSQRMHHPHYIGHQVAVPHLISGAADFIHGSINNPMAIYEMGPSAAVIEKTMINWMLDKIGWLPQGGITDFGRLEGNGTGIFTHGGSLANLTAMLAARAAIAPRAWEEGTPEDLVVIGSEVSHYSIARSISIMGLGKSKIVTVPEDDQERMKAEALEAIILQTRSEGKRIMAVVANACATSTGLYDPLEAIGKICKAHQIWFHIDGAHGASAVLSTREKHLMRGVEYADSMIWDTHKMLRTSTLAAAVLFRNPQSMIDTFQQKGSYLFHEKDNPGFDLMPFTVECTKAALATKLFWVLAAEGEQGLVDFVEHQYQVTRQFHDLIQSQIDFECPYYPEANILCFRYIKHELSDPQQLAIRNALVEEGSFYITSTEIAGIRYLRLTVINPATSEVHILALIQRIREIVAKELH